MRHILVAAAIVSATAAAFGLVTIHEVAAAVALMILVCVWLFPAVVSFFALMLQLERRRPEPPLWLRVRASVIGAILVLALLHWGLPDGWPWSAFPVLGLDDTEFASGYSALGFWRVRRGMTFDDVIARAGRPLGRSSPAGSPEVEVWWWTRSLQSGSYRIRTVVFRYGSRPCGRRSARPRCQHNVLEQVGRGFGAPSGSRRSRTRFRSGDQGEPLAVPAGTAREASAARAINERASYPVFWWISKLPPEKSTGTSSGAYASEHSGVCDARDAVPTLVTNFVNSRYNG